MSRLEKSQYMNLELAELVKQLNNAMEIAHLGMYEWDTVKGTVRFDKRAYEITGIDPVTFDHTMASIIDEIIHPDSRQAFIHSITVARDKNEIPNNSYRLNHPKKSICWVKFMSRIIKEEGKVVRLIGVIMEVTAEKILNQRLRDDAEFIETLIENIPSPIFYKDAKGIYRRFNQAFEDFLGLKRSDIVNKTVYDVAPEALAQIYEEADNKLLEEKGHQIYETLVKAANGEIKNVLFRKSVHLDDEGNALGLIGLMQDVTELRTAEKTIRSISETQKIMMHSSQHMMNYNSERTFLHDIMMRFMPLIDGATTAGLLKVDNQDILSLYDAHGVALENAKLKMPYKESYIYHITQGDYDQVHLVGELSLLHLRSDDLGHEILRQNIIQSIVIIPITYLNDIRWFYIYGSGEMNAFSDHDMAVAEFIRTEMDALIKMYIYFQRTVAMAHYDSVTDLMNRAYFDKRLQEHMGNNQDQVSHIVLIDMDDLKKINDVLGHDAGDRYLKLLGHLLSLHFSGNSFWGRIGGDEFAGLVFNISYETLVEKLESVQLLYQEYLYSESKSKFKSSFSYGISIYPEEGIEYKQLFKTADERMYENKKNRKKGR